MADAYGAQKMPKMRKRPKQKKQRRDYKSRRDELGRYSTTELSVKRRRYIRTLRRKSDRKIQPRKKKSELYNERGGLKSQKRKRQSRRKK